MKTVEDLRNRCKELHKQFLDEEQIHELRRQEVVTILNDWLELFISEHHVWLAIAGNKRCVPIPIHRFFSKDKRLETTYSEYKEKRGWEHNFIWPNLPEKEIWEIIKGLGFIVHGFTLPYISLSVPPYEKGQPLTFAQKWVRKINHSYSVHIAAERKKAEYCYQSLVSQLYDTPVEKIEVCKEYAFFKDFHLLKPTMSVRCAAYIRALMHKDGMKELWEDDKYKGICVFYELPQS